MLKLAEHILETKAGDFDPAEFNDHYKEAVVELIRKKQANLPVKKEKDQPTSSTSWTLYAEASNRPTLPRHHRRRRREDRRVRHVEGRKPELKVLPFRYADLLVERSVGARHAGAAHAINPVANNRPVTPMKVGASNVEIANT